MTSLTLLQLADSAFPTGGFAHSGGLEAAWQAGEVEDLGAWVERSLWSAASVGLPFVGAAHDEPGRLRELDGLCDAFLSNPVAKRASRLQGQALLAACAAAFPEARLSRWAGRATHLAPALGAAGAVLALARQETLSLFTYTNVRGTISAAVRLGICGPLEGQRLQARLGRSVRLAVARLARVRPEDAAGTAPVNELLQSAHDRLYSRLFQS